MLTNEKLKRYQRFNGDIDLWIRTTKKLKDQDMTTDDWHLIEGLLQDLTLVGTVPTSEEFKSNLERRMAEHCDHEETVAALRCLSQTVRR
jgi:hypothetical protein